MLRTVLEPAARRGPRLGAGLEDPAALGPAPDQVVVSFGEDPARTLSITWRTDPSVARLGRPDRPRGPAGPAARPGSSGATPTRSSPTACSTTRSSSAIGSSSTGLEPDTRYAYAVGDGSPGGWGPWHSVRTAPASPRDFGFLYLGDAQCGLERWGELLHAAHRHRPDAGFLLLAGDLVDRGNERTNWDHFFLRAAGVFDEVPLMPCRRQPRISRQGPRDLPGDLRPPPERPARGSTRTWSTAFEYSDAFVAVLDSNLGIHDSRLARVQAEWLDEALAGPGPPGSSSPSTTRSTPRTSSRENPQLAAAWGPVFDKHHVDMVLQGHDHAYLRTRPMRGGRPVGSPAEGTVYVVSVSGEKFYEQDPRGYTARGMTNLATYQTIDVKVRRATADLSLVRPRRPRGRRPGDREGARPARLAGSPGR